MNKLENAFPAENAVSAVVESEVENIKYFRREGADALQQAILRAGHGRQTLPHGGHFSADGAAVGLAVGQFGVFEVRGGVRGEVRIQALAAGEDEGHQEEEHELHGSLLDFCLGLRCSLVWPWFSLSSGGS